MQIRKLIYAAKKHYFRAFCSQERRLTISDHLGSYMLHEIIGLFYREKIFYNIELEKRQQLIIEIIEIACGKHDCNAGKILENYTDYFELCYCCLTSTSDLEEGLCQKCRGEK